MELTQENITAIGKAMAVELYKLQTVDVVTTEEAMQLMKCSRKALYNRGIPHNRCGWSKKAILEYLER